MGSVSGGRTEPLSDIFQEVDEEIRREQFKKLWDRWGNHFLAAAVLVVLGIGGWRAWEWREMQKAQEAGAIFESALSLALAGKHDDAEATFAKVAQDSPAGYRQLARLREAGELAQVDAKAAVADYEKIASDGTVGPVLSDLAALRAGALLIDAGNFDAARKELEPLTGNDRTFRHSARELLVLAAWRAGDMNLAKPWIDMILSDLQTPSGTRSRLEMLGALNPMPGKT